MDPQNPVSCDEKLGQQVIRLVDAMDDHDDVQAVYHNGDLPDELLDSLSHGIGR